MKNMNFEYTASRKQSNKNKLVIGAVAILLLVATGFFVFGTKGTTEPTMKEKAISEIRKFMGDENLKAEYANPSKFAYDSNMDEDIYVSEFDQFEIDSKTGKLLQFGPKPSSAKTYDESSRYSEAELETMAKDYIARNVPEINLANLTPNNGNKEQGHYFFRWEDKTKKTAEGYPFIQVGFSRGGSVLSYINALEIEQVK